MAELKPCPFHKRIEKKKLENGNFYPPDDFSIEESYMFEGYFHVRCCYCHACGPDEETEQQAISAWNKRS